MSRLVGERRTNVGQQLLVLLLALILLYVIIWYTAPETAGDIWMGIQSAWDGFVDWLSPA